MRDSRRVRLTLVLLLLTAFTLTALDYNTARTGPLAALRRGIDTVFGPVTSTLGSAASSVGNALGGLPRLGSYQRDNRRLQSEVDALRGELSARAGDSCRLAQYDRLLDFTAYGAYRPVPARVVAMGPTADFEWTATIDAGTQDGLQPGMSVVTGAGLVGRTTEVGVRTARVLLLADPNFQVGGTLIGQTSLGIASGNGSQPMTYSLASTRSVVRKGAVLLTTGSDTYAPGIPIGTVESVTPDTNAISRTAIIMPFVDVASLDLVGVIKDANVRAPRVPLRPVLPTETPCPAAIPQGPVPTATPTPAPVVPAPAVTGTPLPTATPTP